MIFANLSWDHILGFVRVFAKKQNPGFFAVFAPKVFRLGAVSTAACVPAEASTDHKLVP